MWVNRSINLGWKRFRFCNQLTCANKQRNASLQITPSCRPVRHFRSSNINHDVNLKSGTDHWNIPCFRGSESDVQRARQQVGAKEVDEFRRIGATKIKQLFTAEQIEVLKEGIEKNLANPSQRCIVASGADDPGRFVEDFCIWQNVPQYETIIKETAVAPAAAILMGSQTVRLFHDHLLVKEPGTVQPTPWHQDQPYYNVEGFQNVSFWIPVDTVPKESSLKFWSGSHQQGAWYMPRTFQHGIAKWFKEGSLPDLPDDIPSNDVVSWALEPGDAIAFHMLTIHSAAGVGLGSRRRAYSLRMLGDDMVHAKRSWVTSPEFYGITEEIDDGRPLAHEAFPLLLKQ
eukprot:m.10750 g.10750  ORF g.10750 m.10750 type:complete len:343 (-) comp8463_c0_seq1:71-1099(-)